MAGFIMSDMKEFFQIAGADGRYNPLFIPHLQILSPAEKEGPIAPAISSEWERAVAKLGLRFSPSPERFRRIWQKIVDQKDVLWTLSEMGGAEYRHFSTYVAHAALRKDMTFMEMETEVNFEILPSGEVERVVGKDGVLSLRAQWKKWRGIELPETGNTRVHIIAPAASIAAAQEMVLRFALEEQETTTHRGMGFNRAVAYQGLSAAEKIAAGSHNDHVGWFEIHNDVFFTIDPVMAGQVKTLFGLKEKPETGKGVPKPGP